MIATQSMSLRRRWSRLQQSTIYSSFAFAGICGLPRRPLAFSQWQI